MKITIAAIALAALLVGCGVYELTTEPVDAPGGNPQAQTTAAGTALEQAGRVMDAAATGNPLALIGSIIGGVAATASVAVTAARKIKARDKTIETVVGAAQDTRASGDIDLEAFAARIESHANAAQITLDKFSRLVDKAKHELAKRGKLAKVVK